MLKKMKFASFVLAAVLTSTHAVSIAAQQIGDQVTVASVKINEDARKLLPEKIRASGVLNVGAATGISPYLYLQDDKIIGLEADLLAALGKTLGLNLEVTNTKYPALIPGLISKRIDVALSAFSDTLERQKQVTFVDYTRAGQILMVAKGNPKKIQSMADLCGKSAAGPISGPAVALAQEQSSKCVSEGKPPVDVQQYPSPADALLALQSGRTDSFANDYVSARDSMKVFPEKIETVGKPFALGLHGAAVLPNEKELQAALEAGYNALIKSGIYGKILEKWNVPDIAMDKVLINGSTK
jgi:polar amino acid transport system substrate-binding protein